MFKTTIDAPKNKVWNILWGAETYPQWTSVFSEGSRAESDWEEGGKILFVNAENEGMVSRIAQKKENEFMSFEHLGMIDANGNEDYESEKVKGWAGCMENYELKSENGKTTLEVVLDVDEKYADYFKETFPKALEKVKVLAEQ